MKNLIKHILPYYKQYRRLTKSRIPFTYFAFLKAKILGAKTYWYSHKNCTVANPDKIFVGINCLIGRPGCYIQGAGGVIIGNYVQFGPNVGILSANHDLYDQNTYNVAPIIIGDYSWIGMNCVITAGVELGTRTIVGAGSIVTKSFPDGYCVIAGNPSRVIKYLEKEKFTPWHFEEEYYGLIPKEEFNTQKNLYLNTNFIESITMYLGN